MSEFRKKPVVIEAIEYTGGGNFANPSLPNWMWEAMESGVAFNRQGNLIIRTLEGEMGASAGDWIIGGVAGEIYPCKPEIFAASYEPVAAEQAAPELPADMQLVMAEVKQARDNWPPFNSAHEGFAVLLEEVDELKAHVWTNQKRRDLAAMRKEAMQVAAMALRFMGECCDESTGRK